MRKLLFLLVALPLALFLGACEEEAEEEEVEEEVEVEEVVYELAELEPTPVVFKELTGDYSLHGVAVEEGFEALKAAEIEVVGPVIGFFYDDPALVAPEELRSEVLFPVAADTVPPEGYAYKVTEGGQAVMTVFKGELTEENVPDYYGLFEYITAEGYLMAGPVIEVYYWEGEDPAEYVTEIYVPVVKAEEAVEGAVEEETVEEEAVEEAEETAEEPPA